MLRDTPHSETQNNDIKIGDVCFWRRKALDNIHDNKKLLIQNRGPYKIIRKNKFQVTLQDVNSGKVLKNPVSISQIIRPQLFDSSQYDVLPIPS